MSYWLFPLPWKAQSLCGFFHDSAEFLEFRRFFFGAYPQDSRGLSLGKTAEDLEGQSEGLCLRCCFSSYLQKLGKAFFRNLPQKAHGEVKIFQRNPGAVAEDPAAEARHLGQSFTHLLG